MTRQKNLRNPVAIGNLASYQQTSMRIMPTLRLQYDLDPAGKPSFVIRVILSSILRM